jgi:type II secretory pathway pseudopilin PulG
MIVVAILGILAAIVLPEFQGHIQQAKEAAAAKV